MALSIGGIVSIGGGSVTSGGTSPSGACTFSRTTESFTATADQTTFTVNGGYTVGDIDVYLNGVKLNSTEYTATDGSTVVLSVAAALNDIIEVLVYDCTSGGGGGSSSGIQSINAQTGPAITINGVNGISITTTTNTITVNAAGISGVSTLTKYYASFSSISSGLFTHNLGTEYVIVQVYDDQVPRRQMLPNEIKIENSNEVSVLFNSPQTGRVVII